MYPEPYSTVPILFDAGRAHKERRIAQTAVVDDRWPHGLARERNGGFGGLCHSEPKPRALPQVEIWVLAAC